MNGPLVSVVIPTYNQAAMLVEAVESALAQTYPNREVIVVDDGSTDDTAARMAPYTNSGRVRYLVQQNRRQAAARNAGIHEAQGELIAFLDHDDLWAPSKLERQVPLFEPPEVGLVYSGAVEVDLDGNVLWEKGSEKFCRGRIFDRLLFDHFITNSTVVVRHAYLDRTGLLDEALFAVADMHLWLRICHDYEADFIPDALVSCRRHGANMKDDPRLIPEQRYLALIDIFRRYGLDMDQPAGWRRLNADYQFFLGYQERRTHLFRALGHYLQAMRFEPRWAQAAAIAKLFVPGYEAMASRRASAASER
jgi:glycosyltransferase involved in cell wall biosynthesis